MSSTSASSLNAVSGSFLAMSVVTVGLRFYTRSTQKTALDIDDWIMVPGVLLYLGACITIFIGVNDKVFGYATRSFTESQILSTAKLSAQLQIAWDILSTCALACIKISALFFYRRIFCVSGRKAWFSILTLATAATIILWLITFLLLTGFQCGSHFSALWDGTHLQYCTISFPFLYGLVISDLLLDVWVLALPIPQVLKLQTTRRRRLSILGVFLLAFIGLGASIARMVLDGINVELPQSGPEALVEFDEELTLTKGIYFSMLEAVSKRGLETSLPSIHSILSLRSSGSITSKPSHRNGDDSRTAQTGGAKNSFSGSLSHLTRDADNENNENFAMQNFSRT
ncbi:MAG: hypothetical protein MMC33_010452 [Icmadophila ericetorum]|nr:hypothetical protein [Icmadophila ericetorum]